MRFCVYSRSLSVRQERAPRAALTDRSATILTLIDQRGPLNISELEELLHVSRRTVQYDLRRLVEVGALVISGATNNRRYQRPE